MESGKSQCILFRDFVGSSIWTTVKSLNVKLNCHIHCISESERAERERKGDLDQYERLDGDRNQTSKSLAVKKVYLILYTP